ncbi:MAG: hypothetical protein LBS21_07055 [Clostridiales bacterium]|nr:hypothetical protein [Clostridiales bacterium]
MLFDITRAETRQYVLCRKQDVCAKPSMFFAGGAWCVLNAPHMRRVQFSTVAAVISATQCPTFAKGAAKNIFIPALRDCDAFENGGK